MPLASSTGLISAPLRAATNPPGLSVSIDFHHRKSWEPADILQHQVQTGDINVSSPELTALDLFYFMKRDTDLSRLTGIIEALADFMDAEKLVETARRYPEVTAIQRLGFTLSELLYLTDLAAPLAEHLKTLKYFPILLRPEKEKPTDRITSNQWKVKRNARILLDL